MEICSVGAEMFHAEGRTDRQTDMTKPVVSSRIFTNVPEVCICIASSVYSDRTWFLFPGLIGSAAKHFGYVPRDEQVSH